MKQLKALKNTFYLFGSDKILSLKGNSNADKIKFTVDRYCDGIDLSECTCTIKTKNSNNESDVILPKIDINEKILDINWTITSATTVVSGELMVQIQFEKLFSDGQGGYDETKTIVWQSNIMKFDVQNSLSSDKDIYDQEPTLFQQWEDRISNLVDNQITSLSNEINDSYIANAQKNIANGVPTLNSNAKLDTSKFEESCVTTAKISDSAVTAAKLAAGCVTANKVADNSITEAKTTFLNPSYVDLYDESKAIKGGYWGTSGEWVSAPTIDSSGKIEVTAGLTYTTTESSWRVTWWKSDQTFLTYTDYTVFKSQGYVTAPENACYANFCFSATNLDNRHIIQGTVFPVNNTLFPDLLVNTNNISNGAVTQEKISTDWSGKKWVSYGDSITWYGYWQPYVVNALNLNHTNCGVSSSPIGGSFSNAMWQDSRIDEVKAANPDIVTILGGANDMYKGVSMGTSEELTKTISNKDKTVFYGAYSYIIETLLTWKPTLEIVLMTTMWGNFEAVNSTTGLTYRDFSNATKEIAQHYGLPCVDLMGEMGLNAITANTYLMNDSQYVHPNDAGAKRMARVIIGKLKALQ